MKKKWHFKRWWIPVTGYILAGGFINNLLIAPFTDIDLVDWGGLLTSLGILLGISGIRDYFTKDSLSKLPENVSDKKWKRYWIPIVGWVICAGFFINCILAPYLDIKVNDWTQLVTALSVILGISGARDIGLAPKCTCKEDAKTQPDSEEETEEK